MSESSSPQRHPGAEARVEYVGIPGVRFMPTEEELILDYLNAKLAGSELPTDLMKEADVYREHPKELTERLGRSVEGFWYVFSKRHRKYPNGMRPSRSTGTAGRWKTVGQNKEVHDATEQFVIGHKCELSYEVFVHEQLGDRPQGSKPPRRRLEKTEWKMCEFVAIDTDRPISSAPDRMLLNEWVLCRITLKGDTPSSDHEDDEQAADFVDEPYDYEDEELQDTTPPDPSQEAQVQGLVGDGADGSAGTTEVGAEGFDADVEPPTDGDGLIKEVPFVGCYHLELEVWDNENECGGNFDHEAWNVHGNQVGAAADPDEPKSYQFNVPSDAYLDLSPLEELAEPQPWDDMAFVFLDETVKATDDGGKGNIAPAPAPAASAPPAPPASAPSAPPAQAPAPPAQAPAPPAPAPPAAAANKTPSAENKTSTK